MGFTVDQKTEQAPRADVAGAEATLARIRSSKTTAEHELGLTMQQHREAAFKAASESNTRAQQRVTALSVEIQSKRSTVQAYAAAETEALSRLEAERSKDAQEREAERWEQAIAILEKREKLGAQVDAELSRLGSLVGQIESLGNAAFMAVSTYLPESVRDAVAPQRASLALVVAGAFMRSSRLSLDFLADMSAHGISSLQNVESVARLLEQERGAIACRAPGVMPQPMNINIDEEQQ